MTTTRQQTIKQKPLLRSCKAIEKELEPIAAQYKLAKADLTNARKDLLMDNGICVSCMGKGEGRQDYHDGDSYYWKCTQCDGKSRSEEANKLWASLDIPDELAKRYEVLSEEWERSNQLANFMSMRPEECKGWLVEVVKGRKVKKGTRGIVFWAGPSQYGWRVGLQVEGESSPVWLSIENIAVVFADE